MGPGRLATYTRIHHEYARGIFQISRLTPTTSGLSLTPQHIIASASTWYVRITVIDTNNTKAPRRSASSGLTVTKLSSRPSTLERRVYIARSSAEPPPHATQQPSIIQILPCIYPSGTTTESGIDAAIQLRSRHYQRKGHVSTTEDTSMQASIDVRTAEKEE